MSVLGPLLPALLQLPVFIGLLHVLRSFNRPGLSFEENSAIANYAFAPDQVRSFLEARLFGTPLSAYVSMPQELLDAFGSHVERWEVYAVAVPLMLVAAVATHFSARHSLQLQAAAGPATGPGAEQTASIMKWTPWVFPLGVITGGLFFSFPVAILLYWLANNVWTLGQQRLVHSWLDRHPEPEPAPLPVAATSAVRPGAKPVRGRSSVRTGGAEGFEPAGDAAAVHTDGSAVGAAAYRGASISAKPKRNSSGHRPSRRRR